MQMDLHDEMHHFQSDVMLYTKLDSECDQQVIVVSRRLTELANVHRRQV